MEMVNVKVIGEEDPLSYWDLYAYINIKKKNNKYILYTIFTRQSYFLFPSFSHLCILQAAHFYPFNIITKIDSSLT